MHKLVIKSKFRFFSILEKISIFDFEYGNCPPLAGCAANQAVAMVTTIRPTNQLAVSRVAN